MFFRSRRYSSGANNEKTSTIHTYSPSPTSSPSPAAPSGTTTTGQNGRFRFERPNSAPLPSSSSATSLTPSPPSQAPPGSSISPKAPMLLTRSASSGSRGENPMGFSDNSDVSSVEQRLKIIKRNRVSGKSDSQEPAGTSPSKTRLPKHEQHVIDAMVTECLDALLFPSAL